MKKMVQRFIRDESGAAVINWGVLVGSFLLLSAVAHGTLQDSFKPLSTSASLSMSYMR